MNETNLIIDIIKEIRLEQHISPYRESEEFEGYVKEGMYNINNHCGAVIDYDKDLDARSLLKNYVLYADYKRLAEFKELYAGEYAKLQAEYYEATSV